MRGERDPLSVLREVAALLPPGATVTLPVSWLRGDEAVGQPVRQAPAATGPADGDGDMTVEQVAVRVGRRPSTVRGWCATGILEGYRLNGRDWRIPRAALADFQRRQRVKPAPKPRRTGAPVDMVAWRQARAA
jgi:excisionase family DNA binding protein